MRLRQANKAIAVRTKRDFRLLSFCSSRDDSTAIISSVSFFANDLASHAPVSSIVSRADFARVVLFRAFCWPIFSPRGELDGTVVCSVILTYPADICFPTFNFPNGFFVEKISTGGQTPMECAISVGGALRSECRLNFER